MIMKIKTTVILVICIILALAAGAAGFRKNAAKQAPGSGEATQIRIIATSDIHGKIIPYDYALDAPEESGSLAQISSAVMCPVSLRAHYSTFSVARDSHTAAKIW